MDRQDASAKNRTLESIAAVSLRNRRATEDLKVVYCVPPFVPRSSCQTSTLRSVHLLPLRWSFHGSCCRQNQKKGTQPNPTDSFLMTACRWSRSLLALLEGRLSCTTLCCRKSVTALSGTSDFALSGLELCIPRFEFCFARRYRSRHVLTSNCACLFVCVCVDRRRRRACRDGNPAFCSLRVDLLLALHDGGHNAGGQCISMSYIVCVNESVSECE